MNTDGLVAFAVFVVACVGVGLIRRGRRIVGVAITAAAALAAVAAAVIYNPLVLTFAAGGLMIVLASDAERRSRAAGLALLACGVGLAFGSVLLA